MRNTLALILILGLVACTGGQQTESAGTVASYSPRTQSATAPPPTTRQYQPAPTYRPAPTYQPSRSTASTPAPTYTGGGGFVWHTRIADAQAQAQRERKLILVGSTKPQCSLCDKFKNQIVPSAGTRVSSSAVGYMFNTQTNEAPHVWAQLKANLPQAGLMPLVGVFSPDLRYLSGFGGPPDMNKLLNAISTGRRLYPVSAPAPQRPVSQGGYTAQVNEYGEYEWTPLEALYPRPEDALSPAAAVASNRPVLPPAPVAASAPVVAVAPPAPPTPIAPPSSAVAYAPRPSPAPARQAPVNRPPTPSTTVSLRTTPAAAPRPRPPFSRTPEPALETWGREALRDALTQIQSGDYDRAKSTLAEVHARMPGTMLAREAAKGAVAIYSAQRIEGASGTERERRREQAASNLGSSMWGTLFQS